MATEFVGRIVLENANGAAHFTVDYQTPMKLRAVEIFAADGIYRQQRQAASGRWVYRYARPRGDRPVDPALVDYRNPNHPEWDGPVPAKPPATFDDVVQAFDRVIRESVDHEGLIPAPQVTALFRLTTAAFRGVPYEATT